MNEMQREAELLRQFGLFVRENCYYSIGEDDDEPSRISNFVMEPLFHIEDEINGTRIFRMRNMYNVCRVIELKESGTLLTEQLSAEGRLTGQLCMAVQDRQTQPCKGIPVLKDRYGRTYQKARLECS